MPHETFETSWITTDTSCLVLISTRNPIVNMHSARSVSPKPSIVFLQLYHTKAFIYLPHLGSLLLMIMINNQFLGDLPPCRPQQLLDFARLMKFWFLDPRVDFRNRSSSYSILKPGRSLHIEGIESKIIFKH